MVQTDLSESENSDHEKIINKKTESTPKSGSNSSLQKNLFQVASLSTGKHFLNKMLEKSNRLKSFDVLNNSENIKSKKYPVPLKSILKNSDISKSGNEYLNDSDVDGTHNISFTPNFASTQIEERTPKSHDLKNTFIEKEEFLKSNSKSKQVNVNNNVLQKRNSESESEASESDNKHKTIHKTTLNDTHLKHKKLQEKSSGSESDSSSSKDHQNDRYQGIRVSKKKDFMKQESCSSSDSEYKSRTKKKVKLMRKSNNSERKSVDSLNRTSLNVKLKNKNSPKKLSSSSDSDENSPKDVKGLNKKSKVNFIDLSKKYEHASKNNSISSGSESSERSSVINSKKTMRTHTSRKTENSSEKLMQEVIVKNEPLSSSNSESESKSIKKKQLPPKSNEKIDHSNKKKLKENQNLEEDEKYSSQTINVKSETRKWIPKTPKEKLLHQFQSEQKDLAVIEISDVSNIPTIESDDEVFILTAPKSMRKYLAGVKVSLNEMTKISTDEENMFILPQKVNKKRRHASVLVQQNGKLNIKTLKLSKHLKVYPELEDEIIPDIDKVSQETLAFPENLRRRHPLFGSNYKKKIKLNEVIKNKLENPMMIPVKVKSNKKKKDKEKKINKKDEQLDKNELIFKIFDNSFKVEKNENTNSKELKKNLECLNSNSLNEYLEKNKLKSDDYKDLHNLDTVKNRKRKRKSEENTETLNINDASFKKIANTYISEKEEVYDNISRKKHKKHKKVKNME